MTRSVQLGQWSAAELRDHLDALNELLIDVVNHGASVSFLAPLSMESSARFWNRIIAEVADGSRNVVIAEEAGRVVGCAHLVPASAPNGPHRAEVQKMLVHSQHRRRGLGRMLLTDIEAVALSLGKTLLVLDTEADSAGEALYAACGWQRAGVIPEYALNHDGTRRVDTVVFYKLLLPTA